MQVSCVSLYAMYESSMCVCKCVCVCVVYVHVCAFVHTLCKHADVLMCVLDLYFYHRILMCMQAAMLA